MLYVGPGAHRPNARSLVASSSGNNSDLWRVASWVLKVPICLHNLSTHTMEIPTKAVVGQVAFTNQVLSVVHPTRTCKELHNKSQKGWVSEALDLQGLQEWPESEQKQARELLLKWEHLFACSDLDVGKTALIIHKTEVTDQMPFKENYQCIPPHMYDDMRPISKKLGFLVLSINAQSMG